MPASCLLSSVSKSSVSSFSFFPYQRDDLARAAMHDGAVLAWEPGLGKTLAIFSWPMLKSSQATLIVAPADLHDQIIREGREKFRLPVTVIRDQAAAAHLFATGTLLHSSHPSHWSHSPSSLLSSVSTSPVFFLTDYRWLGYNGGDEWQDALSPDDIDPDCPTPDTRLVSDITRRRRHAVIARFFGIAQDDRPPVHRLDKTAPAHELLGVDISAPRSAIKSAYRDLARLTHPDLHPGDPAATARMQRLNAAIEAMLRGTATEIIKGIDAEVNAASGSIAAFSAGIGTSHEFTDPDGTDRVIKCVFQPTLSTMIADCFDCVVADEAVRLKSGGTYIASGVLGLRSRYRLALTGTPIKNRLPDIFFLASWATGYHPGATARWPYGNTSAHRAEFATHHLVMEQNVTKEESSRAAGNFRRYQKHGNKITNVHLLWKLLGPVVIRRRKDQVGEIAAKTIHTIPVTPGTAQQRVYAWHLSHPPQCKTPMAAVGAQLQILRQAALCPWVPAIARHGQPASVSPHRWSPKMFAILNLAADIIATGQRLVVFSPFQEFSTVLNSLLTSAGVPSVILDGRVANTKRGHAARRFKDGEFPVLICGIDSMGEGHSFECASHLCIPSLSWALDKNRQAIDRVHRIASRQDVNIYLMVTKNSIDERLASVFREKGDSSDLALDGRLFDDAADEVSLSDLLRSAVTDFDPRATTIPEETLANDWNTSLSRRLATASAAYFHAMRGTTSPAPEPTRPTIPAIPSPAATTPTPAPFALEFTAA